MLNKRITQILLTGVAVASVTMNYTLSAPLNPDPQTDWEAHREFIQLGNKAVREKDWTAARRYYSAAFAASGGTDMQAARAVLVTAGQQHQAQ